MRPPGETIHPSLGFWQTRNPSLGLITTRRDLKIFLALTPNCCKSEAESMTESLLRLLIHLLESRRYPIARYLT